MNYLEKYTISFGGLHEGTHSFQFIADDEFFVQFAESPIASGILNVEVRFIKKSHLSELLFDIRGTIKTECDRCLDLMDVSVSYTGSLFLKRNISEEDDKEDDEIVFITQTQTEICIAQYIYEFVILSLPLRRVHPDDKKGKNTCNLEMLKKIQSLSVKETSTTDGRWDDLKKLLN
ncbi:MAG: hypothetical protein A2275_11145 [Bacteroidetes bacterium RIFOXYA12_FULL_35_11]|nr:MAG: hypothetical protein A2X01_16185 [Bacteroidetes bacterium GWF2_35_48]OFY77368.1 MAG: hypothetical protein A2275_11145 [Bacteroidetes bacterium RIFOXYA12_FULL_35_11]OFY93838.1 MAG: hypothetical protein A2491_02845 [Bacteroidetes bacterium RIFOXYC12_FULL_35_7]OFY96764.1 MAG: hypothetical protein A2309_09825 [Bacteroidetes bacterium RIFOXYB2_FULL_35_7]